MLLSKFDQSFGQVLAWWREILPCGHVANGSDSTVTIGDSFLCGGKATVTQTNMK